LEAAKVAAQTKQIEAQTFANPALLEIKKLELQLEIERALRRYQESPGPTDDHVWSAGRATPGTGAKVMQEGCKL
jgi:hypothetical protein